MNIDTIISSLSDYNWFCTDDDTNQYCAELDPFTYAFVQSCGNDVHMDNIDIRDCFSSANKTKETELLLRMYGYDNMKELEETYSAAWAQVLAECVFETISLYKEPIFTGTEEECESIIAKITKSAFKIPA